MLLCTPAVHYIYFRRRQLSPANITISLYQLIVSRVISLYRNFFAGRVYPIIQVNVAQALLVVSVKPEHVIEWQNVITKTLRGIGARGVRRPPVSR
jgi:hypothetical protein